ncbi:ABC transporter ATP-binding protein [Streptomyces sp. NPDC058221]|uniref:ABC transporter ATP-binding protein n=1 Tax=Streptomyces sp. NPDC058221 TaxID=3346388 RepID=UPI0036E4FA20
MRTQTTAVPPAVDADRDHPVPTVKVQVSKLTKSFRRRKETVQVLHGIDLEIADGELLVLLGPSGCGKTTLLRCLVGLERPDGGRVELAGRAVVDAADRTFVQPNRRDVAMVFQNYALWPHMNVAKNVAYPLKSRGLKDLLNNGRVEEVLKLVQCDHLADRYPPELSGGQQQRVSLARALASNPGLLLLDEPLSNLDALLRIELRAQLRSLHRRLGFTGVYVTHDQEEALALGTRVAVMREGRFEQIGDPEEVYRSPATVYVADFLGARNRLTTTVDDLGNAEMAGQKLSSFFRTGMAGEYTLLFRDQDLELRSTGDEDMADRTWLTGGAVREVLPGGSHNEHVVRVNGIQFWVGIPASARRFTPDTDVELGIDPRHTLCYDVGGNLVEGWTHGV